VLRAGSVYDDIGFGDGFDYGRVDPRVARGFLDERQPAAGGSEAPAPSMRVR